MNQIVFRINSSNQRVNRPRSGLEGAAVMLVIGPRSLKIWGMGQVFGYQVQIHKLEIGFELILTWWELLVNQNLEL